MATVSRSVSISVSNDGSSKNVYDDVFSAPAPPRRGASPFSSRVDDYREIFPPSAASLGSSIPILDLPPLDRPPSSGVDYAGVFGGFRDDDGIGVPSEQMFADLKTKAERDARLPRSRVQKRRVPSKSQEFSHGHGNDQTPAPAQTKMQYSKSQEFPRNIANNQTLTSPLDTGTPYLKSDNFSGDFPKVQISATELSQQTVDNVKRFNVSYHKTGQLSKDGANGMMHIAHLHAVPGYTHVIDEVGPVRKAAFDKAKTMSMGDADFSLKVGEVSRPGKHTRAASDLGANDREANCKMQNCSTSVSNSPQSFGSDYFKRSSSQRSKRLGSNRESRAKAGFSTPLLDEELDENSAAAVSAAAMKTAIKEAEEKIQWAKEFLKQLEGNGFIKPTLKDSFRVKAAAGMKHSSEIHGPKENVNLKVKASRKKKCINEEKVLKSNGCLNNRPSEGTNHAGGIAAESRVTGEKSERQKDAMDVKATSEGQLENEVDVLKHRCHGVAAQVDTKMEKSRSFRSPAPETLKSPESVHQRDCANYKTNAHEDLKPEKVYKDEGGEWEAAKHLTQLISGVKSRLVSFISKQADTERRNVQEAPSKRESLEQPEKRACLVRNTETENHGGAYQENHEKLVKMNRCTSAAPGVSVQDSSRTAVDMESYEAEQKEVKMYDAASPDAKTCTNQPCGLSEPIEGLGKIEGEELAGREDSLKQEDPTVEAEAECFQDVQEQSQESLNGTLRAEYGKSEKANAGLGRHADMPETTCQSIQFDGIGTNGENDDATMEDVRSQEPVEKGIDDEKLGGGRVDCGRPVGDGWEETKMSNSAEKKHPEDIRLVEETSMIDKDGEGVIEAEEMHDGENAEKIASQNSMSEATEGHIDVVDEDSGHDEYVAEVSGICKQDQLLGETTEARTLDEVYESVRTKRMAGSATVAFEPKESVEQHMSVQESNQLIREDMCEQTLRSVEVDGGSKHDECFLAVDSMHVQDELSSSSRDNESSAQCALDVDLPSFKIETPGSMRMGDESSDKSRPPVETADDDVIESPHSLATDDVGHDVCAKTEPPFSGGNAESHGLDYVNQCPEPEWKFSFEAKIMTTVGKTSEHGGNNEQPGTVKATGERMLEASMSAGDRLDTDKNEMEIARADESHSNAQITESEIVLDTVQEHSDEAENAAPENEDNEAELSTSVSDANDKAAEQGASSCNGESPYRRKRWFKSGVEMGELRLKDQQNSEGSKIEDGVGTQVDEVVGDSGLGVHLPQADAVSGQDQESGQSNESTHRRRRWFESRGEVLHKPIPFDGVAATEEMDNEVDDRAESKASKEAAHRRRRWFENGEKSGSPQRPAILEQNEVTTQPKEEKETVTDTAKLNEQVHEKSSTEELASMRQNEGQSLQREKERERAAVERAIREARQRAFVEARDRAAEVRLKSTAAAHERQGKTAVSDKASMDAKIRVERAAVERATAEARERAMNKAMSDNAGYKNQGSAYSTSAVNESPQREKAISERNKRTTERAAKALQEKNMRDYLAQKEQAERNRYADVLDAEVKRWSTGKEGNLRSLLSTLQYILGPESGWQPTSLTDLVTTTAVRKAYKRAALCVHPDKLQQRRATVQQKYICEKVFDLLKDAWHRFNPDDR